MTPPRTLHQDPLDGVCASHAAFERMIERWVEGLGEQIGKLAEAVTAQSRANGEALEKVLANQADRRELCGQQNARLDNLEKLQVSQQVDNSGEHKEVWSAINKLRLYVYMGIGIVVAINALLAVYVKTSGH